jgi:class 3 adenylate cyclase
MNVEEWLRSLGLERYEAAFRENEIHETVLPNLTAEDLKELGVGPLGHRRKLLDAIAALRVNADAAASPLSTLPPTPPSAGATPTAAGERRYLTVLFCDLVGSTGISAQLDAEEWRDLVGSYLDAASAAVAELGGHVAKKLGDGLLALFGYPLAHENDVERAVRAALSIQRALNELNRKNASTRKPELTARIGLETGPAVVDATGEIYGDVAKRGCRRWPNRARFWSRRECSARSPGCSWRKNAARTRSKACRSRPLYSSSCVRAAAAAVPGNAISLHSSVATTKWLC